MGKKGLRKENRIPEVKASKLVESWHIREMPETSTGMCRGFLSSTLTFTASATSENRKSECCIHRK
jgi:hypothetical protein